MKILFKSVSFVLVLVLVLSVLPVTAFAAKDKYPNTHINTGDQRVDIVSIAKTQLGYMEGDNNDTKYGTWYGLPNQPWCAMFVSWCARQAQVPLDILRNCAIAAPDPGYFDIPFYDGEIYTPKQGDLFFTKTFSHVGLVDYVDGEYFYTVEGNTNDSGSSMGVGVYSLRRVTKDYYFGVPDYNYISQNHTCDKDVFVEYSSEHPHTALKRCSVCAKVYEDTSDCKKADDCIECSAPEKPVLAAYNDTFLGEDAVTFEWKEDTSVTYYDFVLYSMNHTGEWEEYEFFYTAQSGFTWKLPEGRYKAQLKAYNSRIHSDKYPEGLYTESDGLEFSVNKVIYEISYDLNTGEGSLYKQIKHQGLGSVISDEDVERDGYIFLGWSEDMNAKVPEYRVGDVWTKDASVVLYAVWRDANLAGLSGDSNDDGVINIKDVTAIQKHLAGITEIPEYLYTLADTDRDGELSIKDATAIQKYLAGIPTGYLIGEYL